MTGVPIAQAVVIAGSVNAGNGSMTAGQSRIPHSQRGSAVVIPNSSPARPVALSVAIEDDEDLPKGEMVGLPFSMATALARRLWLPPFSSWLSWPRQMAASHLSSNILMPALPIMPSLEMRCPLPQ